MPSRDRDEVPVRAWEAVPGGETLAISAYQSDFRARQWTIDRQDSWKLERRQHFEEPGFASWEAFARGEWEESLRLIEAERDWLTEFQEENARRGITLWRVRVVEEPVTPYLQWELHLLRLRAECGERIRVVGADEIAAFETDGPLPELVTLGEDTTYVVRYTEHGTLDGAVRFTDRDVTARCRRLTRHLYERGEDIATFFARAVAHLPAPSLTRDDH